MANPSTFLELCQQLRQEARLPSPAAAPTPTTVIGQTGELKTVVDWTAQAWSEIQGQKLWKWMWTNPALTLLANTDSVAGTISEVRYVKDSLYAGTRWLKFYAWDYFRMAYPTPERAAGTPVAWSIRPDGAIVFNSKPAANMAFTCERYANPTQLTVDADVPGLPADLTMLIVWLALMKYSDDLEAGSRRATAQDNASRLMRDLNTRCLPELRLGAALC